jgi:hypothetical protein
MVTILEDGVTELDADLATSGVHRRVAVTTPNFRAAFAAVGGGTCERVRIANPLSNLTHQSGHNRMAPPSPRQSPILKP